MMNSYIQSLNVTSFFPVNVMIFFPVKIKDKFSKIDDQFSFFQAIKHTKTKSFDLYFTFLIYIRYTILNKSSDIRGKQKIKCPVILKLLPQINDRSGIKTIFIPR